MGRVAGAFEGDLYFETFLLPDGDSGFLVACISFDFLHSAAVSASSLILLEPGLEGERGGGVERHGYSMAFHYLGGPWANLKFLLNFTLSDTSANFRDLTANFLPVVVGLEGLASVFAGRVPFGLSSSVVLAWISSPCRYRR